MPQRRTLLKLGVMGALALSGAAGFVALQQGNKQPAANRLSPEAREVLAAVGRAALDGTLPVAAVQQAAALDGLQERLEATVSGLAPHARAELNQLLTLLASGLGRRIFAGLNSPWSEATVVELQSMLQSWRTSRLSLRQQCYHGLRDLTMGAYFADPATWQSMGYPGPPLVQPAV